MPSALDDFAALVAATEVMRHLASSLKEEPARLLGYICREYEKTGEPVPDHRLNPIGYISEVSLRALVLAELVHQQGGDSSSLYCYEPTPEGMKQHEALKASGFYDGR